LQKKKERDTVFNIFSTSQVYNHYYWRPEDPKTTSRRTSITQPKPIPINKQTDSDRRTCREVWELRIARWPERITDHHTDLDHNPIRDRLNDINAIRPAFRPLTKEELHRRYRQSRLPIYPGVATSGDRDPTSADYNDAATKIDDDFVARTLDMLGGRGQRLPDTLPSPRYSHFFQKKIHLCKNTSG